MDVYPNTQPDTVVSGVKVRRLVSLGPGECDRCAATYAQGDAIWPVGEAGQVEWLTIGCTPECAAVLVAQLAMALSQPETLCSTVSTV